MNKAAQALGKLGGQKTMKTKGRKHFVNAAKTRWAKQKLSTKKP